MRARSREYSLRPPHTSRRSEAKPRYSISPIRSSARRMFSVLLA